MRDHSNRIFWGVVFVLLGALFLARNMGYIDLHHTMRTYWPVFLILIGLNIVIKSYSRNKSE
jgi:hypothetical protein